jgi:hypothetical protein
MSKKINCQLMNILLNENNEFSGKYCCVSSGNYEYDSLMKDYFINKNMRLIKVDNNNQSLCFTNQKELISFYNQDTKKNEQYYEEIHIHCNELYSFDEFINFLYKSEYSDVIDETDSIPHYDLISKGNFKEYELIMEPMTNEVVATKSLLNLLSQRSDETIFRALAIHFGKLVDRPSEIDINLVHILNEIYQKEIKDNSNLFFSNDISNKLLNIVEQENNYQRKLSQLPSENIKIENKKYSINFDSKEVELS